MSSPKSNPKRTNELTSQTNKTFYQSKINPLKVAEQFHRTAKIKIESKKALDPGAFLYAFNLQLTTRNL